MGSEAIIIAPFVAEPIMPFQAGLAVVMAGVPDHPGLLAGQDVTELLQKAVAVNLDGRGFVGGKKGMFAGTGEDFLI